MDQFWLYLTLGLEHITDLAGYDHILFIVALTLRYDAVQWRQLLWLVTAFTLGHSLTLALATLDLVQVSRVWVEFLIPVTIILTCLSNFVSSNAHTAPTTNTPWQTWRYTLAVGFGLIHGLGFSSYLSSLLGRGSSILGQLFAFNVGLELGQLAVVLVVLALGAIFVQGLGLRRQHLVWALSTLVLVAATRLAFLTFPL